jgi:hypothetical protein
MNLIARTVAAANLTAMIVDKTDKLTVEEAAELAYNITLDMYANGTVFVHSETS